VHGGEDGAADAELEGAAAAMVTVFFVVVACCGLWVVGCCCCCGMQKAREHSIVCLSKRIFRLSGIKFNRIFRLSAGRQDPYLRLSAVRITSCPPAFMFGACMQLDHDRRRKHPLYYYYYTTTPPHLGGNYWSGKRAHLFTWRFVGL